MGRIVIAAYKPKPGKENELNMLIHQHVPTLRKQQLVTDRQSIIMRAEDGTVIEVFEWKSKESIEKSHVNTKVLAMWRQYADVCDYIPISELEEANVLFSEFTPMN